MKRLLWLPVLCCACWVTAQDVSQKIDFSSPAATTRSVLDALSRQTGVPLLVTGPAAEEIVLVHVKGAVLNDVLKRIAEVTSCEWKAEGDGFRLQPAIVQRGLEAKKERDERVAALRKQLAERLKALNSPQGDAEEGGDGRVFTTFGGRGAASKAITRLMSEIDVAALADLKRGQRVVYSTAPTRMQRSLGRSTQAVIAELVRDHNIEASQMRESIENQAMTEEERKMMEMAQRFMGKRDQVISTLPTKALLIGHRESMFDSLGVTIQLYDAQGKILLTEDDNLMLDLGGLEQIAVAAGATGEDSQQGRSVADLNLPPELAEPDPTPIVFSPLSKELAGLFGGMGIGSSPFSKPMSKELRQALLRPDLHDPLSFAPSETLIAIANAKNLQIVASLPDILAGFMNLLGNASPTVGQALHEYLLGDELECGFKDGWLTVRPKKPAANREVRVERSALARILAAGDRKGVPSLDDIAAYALASPPPMETPAAQMSLMFFAPNVVTQGLTGPLDWTMLKFYATLTQGQREMLLRGGQLAVPAMTLPQRDLVATMAFGTQARLRVGPKPSAEGFGFMEMMRAFMPASTDDFRQEPTELMPNGLPPAAVLTVRSRQDPIAVLASEPEGGAARGLAESGLLRGALGADELALFEYFRQDPNFAAVATMMPQLGKVRLGTRAHLEFAFNLGPNVFMDRELNDDAFDASAEPVSLDNLPPAFRDQVAKRVEALKKSPLPFFGGMGTRTVPPPR